MMTSLSDNLSRPNLTKFKEPWRQFEDTEANTNIDTTSKMDIIDNSEVPQINKRLVFDVSDGYDEEDEDHSGSHDNAEIKNKPIKSRSSDGIIRKRIDFGSSEDDVHDRDPSPIRHLDFDSDSEDSESGIHQKKLTVVSSAFKSRVTIPTYNMKDRKVASESCICIRSSPHRAMEFGDYKQPQYSFNPNLDCKVLPSPHRTRSGRIYTSGDSPSAVNEYCPACKPQTTFLMDCHQMPSENISSLKQLPVKRPFRDDNIEDETRLSQPACNSDNVHLNLLQSDLVNEIAAKRPKRNIPVNAENSNMYNEGRNTCMSDSSTNVLPDPCHPDFELPPPTIDAPPPLEYVKRPVSRLSLIREKMQLKKKEEQLRLRTDLHFDKNNEGTPECHALHRFRTPSFESYDAFPSPGYIYQTPTNQHSPPTNEVRAMRIFDSNSPKGPRVPACDAAPKFRIPFENIEDSKEESSGHQRRKSAPGGVENPNNEPTLPSIDRFRSEQSRKRLKRVANVNPFTPTPTFDSIKRRKVNGTSFM